MPRAAHQGEALSAQPRLPTTCVVSLLRSAKPPVPGRGTARETAPPDKSEVSRHRAMTWAQRLKRVFSIDIERCRRCGGRLRVISSIEEPDVITRILAHLDRDEAAAEPAPPSRGPPPGELPF